jgi:hypothetical protein
VNVGGLCAMVVVVLCVMLSSCGLCALVVVVLCYVVQLNNITHETTKTIAHMPPTFIEHDYNITISGFNP